MIVGKGGKNFFHGLFGVIVRRAIFTTSFWFMGLCALATGDSLFISNVLIFHNVPWYRTFFIHCFGYTEDTLSLLDMENSNIYLFDNSSPIILNLFSLKLLIIGPLRLVL